MRLAVLVCQLGLILRTQALIPDECIESPTNRPPENTDITVICGTEYMDVSIYLCPVYQSLYNQSLMLPNHQTNNKECSGTADFSVDPPVLKFRFPLNKQALLVSCNNISMVTTHVGRGFVNVTGRITAVDPALTSSRPQTVYRWSCLYPQQHFPDTIYYSPGESVRDNKGHITNLRVELYADTRLQENLFIPTTGLKPGRKICVAVEATDLSEGFYVLLDRCYASSTIPKVRSNVLDHNIFDRCTNSSKTQVLLNGKGSYAAFCFEVFRLKDHKYEDVSDFYLHCVTRLCEVSSCSFLKNYCGYVPRPWLRLPERGHVVVTSPLIRVAKPTQRRSLWPDHGSQPSLNQSNYFYNGDYSPFYHYDYQDYLQDDSVFGGSSSLSGHSGPVVAATTCSLIFIFFSI